MGKGHSGTIVTVVDRKTRLSKITYVKSKASSEVHHELDKKLSCTSYFINPYCS